MFVPDCLLSNLICITFQGSDEAINNIKNLVIEKSDILTLLCIVLGEVWLEVSVELSVQNLCNEITHTLIQYVSLSEPVRHHKLPSHDYTLGIVGFLTRIISSPYHPSNFRVRCDLWYAAQ